MEKESKKSKERVIQLAKLVCFTSVVTTIQCDNCKDQGYYKMDEFDSIGEFYNEGWRVKNDKCLCPKCK